MPDPASRLAGLQTGEYHYARIIRADQYARLMTIPGVEPRIVKLGAWLHARLNHKQGVMSSKKVRQAVQAALDIEPIMAAAIGHPDFYRLEPSLFPPEQWPWHSTAGGSAYNQRDKGKARRLLQEAGYAGQPVRWMTTKEFDFMYQSSLVASKQLEEVGLKIDFQVYDWATLLQRNGKPELWDVSSMVTPFYADPSTLLGGVSCVSLGWWCLEEKERLIAEFHREPDIARRKAVLERIQTLFYEDVGHISLGTMYALDGVRKELRWQFRSHYIFAFWNAWLEKTRK